jgi:hypothetical protein
VGVEPESQTPEERPERANGALPRRDADLTASALQDSVSQ